MNIFRRSTFVMGLYVVASAMMGQVVQQGVVMEYQGAEAKTPLAGVSVSARDAGAVMSDVNGNFRLEFRTLHAGDAIQLRRVEMSGYEVMNSEALELAKVSRVEAGKEDESSRLAIVMCSREMLLKLKEGYRSVAVQRYEKQLQLATEEIERLRKSEQIAQEEYNTRMAALEEAYDQKLSNLENYIDKFARIDLSELEQDELRIIELVQAGEFEEALKVYESQNLSARLAQNLSDRQQLQQMQQQLAQVEKQKASENLRLRQSIERQVTLLRMAGGEENMLKAHKILHETFLADTTDWMARKEYAASLLVLGQHNASEQLLLAGSSAEQDLYAKGMMMLDLMSVYCDQDRFDEALSVANTVDSMLTPLIESNYNVLTRALPGWSSVQLRHYLAEEDWTSCQRVVTRIREQWTPDSMQVKSYRLFVRLLCDMNEYYSHTLDHQQSLWCMREAIRMGAILERRFPWMTVLPEMYANATSTFLMEGLKEEGIRAARKSAELLTRNVQKMRSWVSYVDAATGFYTLTDALVLAREYVLADSLMRQVRALELFEKAVIDKESLLSLYADLYHINEAKVWISLGKVDEAEALSNQALTHMSAMEEGADMASYLHPDVSARLALARQQYKTAEEHCQKAIAICSDSYQESQNAWDADNVCRYYLLMCDIHLAGQAKTKALKMLKQAEKVAFFECNRQDIESMRNKIKQSK